MGILNYTTKINPLKTATEIQHILAVKGATSVSIDYMDGEPVALSFKIEVRGWDVAFRLPCNWKGVEKALQRDVTIPSQGAELSTGPPASALGPERPCRISIPPPVPRRGWRCSVAGESET